jgi:hypothetical protein
LYLTPKPFLQIMNIDPEERTLAQFTEQLTQLGQLDGRKAFIIKSIDAQIDKLLKNGARNSESEDVLLQKVIKELDTLFPDRQTVATNERGFAIARMPHRIVYAPKIPRFINRGLNQGIAFTSADLQELKLKDNAYERLPDKTPEYLQVEYTELIRQTVEHAITHAAQLHWESTDHAFARYAFSEAIKADNEYLEAIIETMLNEGVQISTTDAEACTALLREAQQSYDDTSNPAQYLATVYSTLEKIPQA